MGAYGFGPGEEVLDDLGGGAGGDVEVLRLDAEEEIADAAAGKEGLVSGDGEGTNYLQRGAIGGALDVLDGCGCRMGTVRPCCSSYTTQMPEERAGSSTAFEAANIQSGDLRSASGLILGIESSCDETAAAVVRGGTEVLSSVVASQVDLHALYGGVVPELASREHLRNIVPVVRAAMARAAEVDAGVTMESLDAIAVTRGLAGGGVAGGDHVCEGDGVCAPKAADRGESFRGAYLCGADAACGGAAGRGR